MAICEGCEKQSNNAKANGYETLRKDLHCIQCKCPLITKTKSLSTKCPLDKWGKVTTEEERFFIEQELSKNQDEKDELQK